VESQRAELLSQQRRAEKIREQSMNPNVMMTLGQITGARPELKQKNERAKLFELWGEYLRGERCSPESDIDIDSRTVGITMFKDETAQTLNLTEQTLPSLCDRILATTAPSKDKTPWLKLAKFGNLRSDKNCLRTNTNLREITGIECDYDGEEIAFKSAIHTIRDAGIRALIYTSASHTEEKPRWRILAPLSQNHPPETREKMVARLNGLFGGAFAPESFALSTGFHYGSVNSNPHHRAVVLDGDFLDLRDDLYAGSIFKDGSRVGDQQRQGATSRGARDDDKRERVELEKIVAALDVISSKCAYRVWIEIGAALHREFGESGFTLFDAWSAKSPQYDVEDCKAKWKGLRSMTQFSAGTILHYADLASPGWRDRYAEDQLKRSHEAMRGASAGAGASKVAATSNDSGKPEIQVINGKLSEHATAGEACLIAAGLPLYRHGEKPVRPIIEIVDASHGRKTKVAQLKVIDAIYLRDLLCRTVIWQRWDGRSQKLVRINAPAEIANTILARVGELKFPALAGVISTPTMRPDGSLLTSAGYDNETRLLLIEPPPMQEIPDKPTRDDALKALALIEGLLTEFPFIDDVATAVALAAILTPIARGAFMVSPMFLSNAPVAGSGKSFLWDIVAAIAIGQLMPVMAAGRNEEETEKRLGAALIAGQPLINIDNISGELRGDALCQIIERPIVDVRILGKSECRRVEARGTTLYGSGNNLIVRGDLTRRVLTTTLDPRVERPELRQFKSDPVATVLADRGLYIAACLTICKAYIAAGRPNLARKLASFEGWSDTVRSALIWLGKADPVASMELSRADDPERLELSNLLIAWADAIGVGEYHRCTLANVIEMADKTTGTGYNDSQKEPEFPELHAAVTAAAFSITAKRGQQPDAATLGLYMRGRKNRVVDGRRFVTKSNPKGGSVWWIEDIKPDQADHPDQDIDQARASKTKSVKDKHEAARF
jgi:hypothetical protein